MIIFFNFNTSRLSMTNDLDYELFYSTCDRTIPTEKNPPESIDEVNVVKVDTTDGFRFFLADNTWLLIRFSGTEPPSASKRKLTPRAGEKGYWNSAKK